MREKSTNVRNGKNSGSVENRKRFHRVKLELLGKIKVDIFKHLGTKLPKKRPFFSILLIITFSPPLSPLKYEKIKRKTQIAYKFIS